MVELGLWRLGHSTYFVYGGTIEVGTPHNIERFAHFHAGVGTKFQTLASQNLNLEKLGLHPTLLIPGFNRSVNGQSASAITSKTSTIITQDNSY